MRLAASIVIMLPLLTACATAPRPVQVMEVCPRIPVLELQIKQEALDSSFLERMQLFLSGKLPEPISYELPLLPASQTGLRLNAR